MTNVRCPAMNREMRLNAPGWVLQNSCGVTALKTETPFPGGFWRRAVELGENVAVQSPGHSPDFGDIPISFWCLKADRYPSEFQRKPRGIHMQIGNPSGIGWSSDANRIST